MNYKQIDALMSRGILHAAEGLYSQSGESEEDESRRGAIEPSYFRSGQQTAPFSLIHTGKGLVSSDLKEVLGTS